MSSETWISDRGSSSSSNNNTATTAPNINSSTSCNSSPHIPHNGNYNDNNVDLLYSPTTCSSYNLFLPSDDDSFYTFNPRMNDILLTTDNNSPSFSPSSDDFNFDNLSDAIATQNRLNQASSILDNHHLHNSYTICLSTLHKSIKQVHALRQENETLRLANADLIHRLNLLSQANCLISSSSTLNNEISSRRSTTARDCRVIAKSTASPTSVIQQSNNHHKFSLPKSISVRSSCYEKTYERSESTRNMNKPFMSCNTNQQRVTTAPTPNESQRRLYEAEAVEFNMEVYNQGMQKTELCNKWQETVECPYGGNCRFAHGISELRPVIRHPRYKTEICRMFLSGNMCPYGHRCHFRHSAIDQDRI